MAITSLTCPPPVRRSKTVSAPDYEVLHAAVASYDNGDHRAALVATFAHLFPDREPIDPFVEPFSFVQGSSRVSVSIDNDHLVVQVPLVQLTDDSLTTAALRFLLSRIGGTGQLFQPRLHDAEVRLEFTDRTSRLHPHKVLEVLRRMPVEADTNDDWMVEEFQCVPLQREPIEALTEEEFAQAQGIWRTHWTEVNDLVNESRRKRSMFFLNEVTAYAMYHVRAALPLTGYWASRLLAAADTFNDADTDPNLRENSLSKCATQMLEVPSDHLRGSLAHAHYAISPRADGTPKVLTTNLGAGEYLDTIIRLHNGGRYMEAGVALLGTYNYLLACFSWPPATEEQLWAGLSQTTGRPFREATATLLQHSEAILAAEEADEQSDEPSAAQQDGAPQ